LVNYIVFLMEHRINDSSLESFWLDEPALPPLKEHDSPGKGGGRSLTGSLAEFQSSLLCHRRLLCSRWRFPGTL